MPQESKIEWCTDTWNPIRGCSIVSPGCEHCYAMKTAARFSGVGGTYEGLTKKTSRGPVWTGEVREIPHKLEDPLHWKKPRRVFVNSMSDLFHEDVSDDFLDEVFAVMALAPQHTFQILTKRADRMRDYASGNRTADEFCRLNEGARTITGKPIAILPTQKYGMVTGGWPLPNAWLGVSVEDQQRADERIPHLLETPAAVRFLSCEPLLGPVDLEEHLGPIDPCPGWPAGSPEISWVIVGGESGPKARPCEVEWLRDIRQQCNAASVPLFVKQVGANYVDAPNGICGAQTRYPSEAGRPFARLKNRKGGDMEEWPEDLRVREFPK